MKIIIDPGHGGSDPGVVAFGTTEKKLNLLFSKFLANKLEELDISVDKSLISDTNYSAQALTDAIKNSSSSICISCHNNAYNGNARGFEVIHSIHSSGNLAESILKEVEKTGFKTRRIFSRESSTYPGKDYYYVIRLTYPQVETIIVEFGFMDNAEDYALLTNSDWQDRLTSAVAEAIKSYVSTEYLYKTSIAGNSILTTSQLKSALKENNPNADADIVDLYYSIGQIYGIKADLAFLQSMRETNWLKFTGIVKPEQNNFAGLGVTGGGNTGERFSSVEVGVEAHIQHLYAYAFMQSIPLGRTLYDTRFNLVQRGSAPNWEDLNGKWAVPGIGYGQSIVTMQEQIFKKYPPSSQPELEEPSIPNNTDHWAKPCNDELMEAGLLYNDHTETLDSFATEGVVICLVNRLRKELMNNE